MEGKFTIIEKIILFVTFMSIILTLVFKYIFGAKEIDTVVGMGFFDLMIFVIFLVVAKFPATWNMTNSQKARIKDLNHYQSRYRFIIVILDLVLCLFMDFITICFINLNII